MTLAAHVQRHLPLRKLAIFARTYAAGDVVSQLPLYCYAKLVIGQSVDTPGGWEVCRRVPLGQLGTDHVGYASFDLSIVADLNALVVALEGAPEEVRGELLNVELQVWVAPFADEFLAFEALAIGDIDGDTVVVRYEIAEEDLVGRTLGPALASMQDPGIDDWRLSPSSFATTTGRLVGEDGCEELYPANVATHHYGFHQLVRLTEGRVPLTHPCISGVRYGYQLEYTCDWYPIGHSLGRVNYSLPLAPGERVNLAVIDWSRADEASRGEDTGLGESLTNDQLRDRLISEAVYATVVEHQSGRSSSFGLSLSALVPVGGPAFAGGSLGIGSAKSSSTGSREVSSDTTQSLSDGFHQAASALRQLHSTVVTQAAQAEKGSFETRVFANHNHCHTLTILYYEVLQHYRVVTRYSRRRPVLYLDYSPEAGADADHLADETFVLAHRRALEEALLDRRHSAGFKALIRKRVGERALGDAMDRWASRTNATAWVFRRFVLMFTTGEGGTDHNPYVNAFLVGGRKMRFRQTEPLDRETTSEYYFGSTEEDFNSNQLNAFVAELDQPVRWRDLRGFVVGLRLSPRQAGNWRLNRLRILGLADDGNTGLLLDQNFDYTFSPDSEHSEVPVAAPPATEQDPRPVLSDFVPNTILITAQLLLEHLAAHRAHYAAALLTDLDPVKRLAELADARIEGHPLADLIDETMLGRAGYEIAFPLTLEGAQLMRGLLKLGDDSDALAGLVSGEALVGLPTRGVFAESKLGRCSACEHRDDSRFWDWQASPIPEDAPQIAPVDTSSRYQRPDSLAPTQFPTAVVAMATPPAAPDPVAMANALQLLGKGDVFRDMSGMQQLGSMLSAMTQSTTAAVSAAVGRAQENQLAEKILDSDKLDAAQKTEILKSRSSSSDVPSPAPGAMPSSETPGQSIGSGADGDRGGSGGSGAAGASAGAGPAGAPGPTGSPGTPGAPGREAVGAKPVRPRRTLKNTIVINMRSDKGEPYNFNIGMVTIAPRGGPGVYSFDDKQMHRVQDPPMDVNGYVRIQDAGLPRKGVLVVRNVWYIPASALGGDAYSDLSSNSEFWWNVDRSTLEYEFADESPEITLTMQPQVEVESITDATSEQKAHLEQRARSHAFHGGGGVEFNVRAVRVKLGGDYTNTGTKTTSDTETSGSSHSETYNVYAQTGTMLWLSSDGTISSFVVTH